MSAKNAPPSKDTLHRVEQLTGDISVAAIRAWLHGEGIETTARTHAAISNFIAHSIDKGTLKLSELQAGVLGIEEASGKRVNLFDIDDPNDELKNVLADRVKAAKLNIVTERKFAPGSAAKPAVVYATLSGTELRVKWVETHESLAIDYDHGKLHRVPEVKVIVLTANAKTKRAEIRFDRPETFTPHSTFGRQPQAYLDHYRDAAAAILGCSLNPSDIRTSLANILEESPRIVKIKHEAHTDETNCVTRSTIKQGDLRDNPGWKASYAVGGETWALDAQSFYWDEARSKAKLHRDLFTHIDANDSFLRVMSDCTETELEYAIEQIRAHQV